MTEEEGKLLEDLNFFRKKDLSRSMGAPNCNWQCVGNSIGREENILILAQPEYAECLKDYLAIESLYADLLVKIESSKMAIIDRKLRELRILGMK